MNRFITLITFLCISLTSLVGVDGMLCAARKKSKKPQTKETISQRKQQNIKEIKETNKKIQSNAREVTQRLNELNLLTAEMNECNATVQGINGSINALNNQISQLTDSVTLLDNRLSTMSDKYAKAMRKMQTRNSAQTSNFAFIFSAKSFGEAYRRSRSLKQFSNWRKRKADELNVMKNRLDARRKSLEDKKAERVVLLDSLNGQLTLLANKKSESDKLVGQLRREGTQLKNVLAQKQQEANDLDRELNRLIQLEQERQRAERLRQEQAEKERLKKEQAAKEQAAREQASRERRAKESQAKQPEKPAPAKSEEPVTQPKPSKPAEQKPQVTAPAKPVQEKTAAPVVKKQEPARNTSAKITDFPKAKGSLPYPVKGKIVKKFGRQQHPDLKHVVTDNPGIDIETSSGAGVRAVFNGYVSDIFRLPGYNTIVMLRHGNYLTIYANLGSINVKKGDQVKQGQEIGSVFADPDDNSRSVLHFEVRNERSKEDPEQWLR